MLKSADIKGTMRALHNWEGLQSILMHGFQIGAWQELGQSEALEQRQQRERIHTLDWEGPEGDMASSVSMLAAWRLSTGGSSALSASSRKHAHDDSFSVSSPGQAANTRSRSCTPNQSSTSSLWH